LMLTPLKVATPDVALRGLVDTVREPPPGFVPMARVMELVAVVIVLPPASCTVTTGWVDRADPPVPLPGCVVKASLDAVPTVILKVLLIAWVSVPLVAISV